MDVKTKKVCPHCGNEDYTKVEQEHYSCSECNQAFTEALEVVDMPRGGAVHLPTNSLE
jgi:ribosomal protein L37AE/L43A